VFTSLRYQRKNHYRSFHFALLLFDTIAITVPHFSISLGAFAVSKRVFTTEACAAPEGVYTLHTKARAAAGRVCTTEVGAAPGGVCTTGA
jgi:hypothetical protein